MDVSIIIVNYNTAEITSHCIDSIYKNTTGVTFEVILVDNASTDGSKERFENDKRITYIYSTHNGGFGFGNNLGIKKAKGKYLLLLNSDTLLINNAVKEFYDYATKHNPKTLYGCYLVGGDRIYRTSFFFFPAFTIIQFIKRQVHRQNYKPDYTTKEVECICGADLFMPRQAIKDCGLFDENIFLYGEEGELQYRMMQKGYKRMLLNKPKIIHLEGISTVKSKHNKSNMKSHFYILKKHMNLITYLLARLYYYIHP